MKKIILSLSVIGLFFISCTGMNVGAGIYRMTSTNPTHDYTNPVPMEYRGGWVYHDNTVSGQVGLNAESKLRGEACTYSVLWLGSWGDASLEAAKKNGKITRVASSEFNQFGILGFVYHSFCTIVTGDGEIITSVVEPEIEPDSNLKTASTKKGKKGEL